MLSDRDIEIICHLRDGMDIESILDMFQVTDYNARGQARRRLLERLGLDDFTQVRLWASPITDKELARLCGFSAWPRPKQVVRRMRREEAKSVTAVTSR